MRNLIPHPTSAHSTYFWRTPLAQKQEIPKKLNDDVKSSFFNDTYPQIYIKKLFKTYTVFKI